MRLSKKILICAAVFATALSVYFIFFVPSKPMIYELTENPDAENFYQIVGRAEIFGEGIEIISIPESVKRGSEAEVNFRGEPDAKYEIRVYYSSGLSESKSFSPKKADEDGCFGWKWRISGNARKGDIRVIVTGDDVKVSFFITVS